MSKIQQELADVTEVTPSKKRDETITSPEYLARLAAAVAELADADWDKLSPEAQGWYNSVVDANDSKKPVPSFPDLDPPPAAAGGRRRASSAAEPAAAEPFKPKVGVSVKVTTKRGATAEGKIVELDGTLLILETADGDKEFDTDRLDKIEPLGGGKADPEPDAGDAEPAVGDTVEIKTKRGTIEVGNVVEMDDEVVIIKTSTGEEKELSKSRVESIKVKVKASKGGRSAAPEGKGGDAEPEGKGKRTGKAENGGVSVTVRMREIILDNVGWTKDKVAEQLKKETLEFKPNTLDLVFAEVQKLLVMLRERKMLVVK